MTAGIIEEQRRTRRTPWRGSVVYQPAPGERGFASWRNISHNGASLQLGRFLRPGRFAMLISESPFTESGTIELKARVVWCRPTQNSEWFVAGVRIYHDDLNAALAYTLLVDQAARKGKRTTDIEPVATERQAT